MIEYEELSFHTEVHWLSIVKVLRRFYEDMACFMTMKGKVFPATKGWKLDLCDLAFMCDITEHLHNLNIKLQECKHLSTDMHAWCKAFWTKLHFWENQIQQGNYAHSTTCQSVTNALTTAFPNRVALKHWWHFQQNLAGDSPSLRRRNSGLSCLQIHFEFCWQHSRPLTTKTEGRVWLCWGR